MESSPHDPAEQARRDLAQVTRALAAAEDRPGQQDMAAAVATAISGRRHLVVQAGTGTGKSAAYLIPAITSAVQRNTGRDEAPAGVPESRPVVVVTASKALQDQLATKDLPFISEHLGVPFDWAVLKGRSNYLCLQRLRENAQGTAGSKRGKPKATGNDDAGQGVLDLGVTALNELPAETRAEIKRLTDWAAVTGTGDQSELDWSPSERAWAEVSVGSEECPGGQRCPMGAECFAEAARARAAQADVTVVNTYLYGLDVASDGAILPDHDVVIFDEAHQLEAVMSDTVGVSIGPGRFSRVAQALRRVVEDPLLVGAVADVGPLLREVLAPEVGNRLPNPLPAAITDALVEGRLRLDRASEALRNIDSSITDKHGDAKQRLLRAATLILRLAEHIDVTLSFGQQYVAFVSGGPEVPRLEVAPLEVGPVMSKGVWSKRTAILTSATIPASLAERVGLPADTTDTLDVGSPFDYEHNGLLYCAMHLPDPRNSGYATALHDELASLIIAAGGRTLALFSSWRGVERAADYLRVRLGDRYPLLVQRRGDPVGTLVDRFARDESSVLLGTVSLWQGVDVPGSSCVLVVIDRIPFPRPDDPLMSARQKAVDDAGGSGFRAVAVPRAGLLLAQGAGRLIRGQADRGVVAVLDSRLATAGYGAMLRASLPPFWYTTDRATVIGALARLRDDLAGD